MNIHQLRADTPACETLVHLNNAGAALMPTPVVDVVQAYIALEARIGGYEAAEATRKTIRVAYDSVADLIGARPKNIAFTENATVSYSQALSSIPLAPGDTILTTRNDYVSNQIQLLSLRKRFGINVLRAPDAPSGGVDVSAMEELVRTRRPKIVCVTHIPTNSGLVQDIESVGKVCREEGIPYLVDACQSVGQTPIDVDKIGCDFLAATSRKFLRGPRGSGFLFVSDRMLDKGLEPLFPDLGGAEWISENLYQPAQDAKRFENWEFAYALLLGTGEAARYAMAVGIENIEVRVRALARRLREGLNAIDGVRVLDRGAELAGIVSVSIDGWRPESVVLRLREEGINTSFQVQTGALLDFEDKGVDAALRISPHYYNTEQEIDRAVSAIQVLTSRHP